MTARVTVVPRSPASSLASRSASMFLMLSATNATWNRNRKILPLRLERRRKPRGHDG